MSHMNFVLSLIKTDRVIPRNSKVKHMKSSEASTVNNKMKKIKNVENSSIQPFDGIVLKGARVHNLKNVDLNIPRNKLTVITGLSGSGKSSIAFDTIYAEGQRRYIESLSAYARNFMEQLEKPEFDSMTGLSPSIAIDQKSISTNPRSTVGTVTEIYDFLRLLYARVGQPNCPVHNIPVQSTKPEQILNEILKLPKNTKFTIMAPMAQGDKGEYFAEFQKWIRKGFVKAKIDGQVIDLDKAKKLEKHKRHDIDLIVDKLLNEEKYIPRIRESINRAVSMAKGSVAIEVQGEPIKIYSIHRACPICAFSFPDLEPRMFSFNNPRGACSTCHGLGVLAPDLEGQSVRDSDTVTEQAEMTSQAIYLDSYVPSGLKKKGRASSDDDDDDTDENDYTVEYAVCPDCKGLRLKKSSLNVFLHVKSEKSQGAASKNLVMPEAASKNIAQLAAMSAEDLRAFFSEISFSERDQMISEKIIKQITNRLDYMIRVGTSYLSLDRQTRTLSGGEVQRIRLATQVGSSLIGILYVLDEPSIGLHPRDHHRLLGILKELRDRGNTVLLVEHDEETIRNADYVIDIGPGAGRLGGEVIAVGAPQDIQNSKHSLTGKYLRRELKVPVPALRRKGTGEFLNLLGASGNNLKTVDLKIPLGTLCGVSGVSGSGKSTLIIDTLYKALANTLNKNPATPSPFVKIEGVKFVDRIIQINQRPIGRTPRSTPSTYVGLYTLIRDLFANLPEAKIRGYKPGQFSFNVKSGRCETCEGAGLKRIAMHFLADVYVKCDICQGTRYNAETRSVRYRDKSISDVLNMTVGEALEFFKNHAIIHRKLVTLNRVGLDYLTLGQSSTTLSGGEAQRIKLSKELSKRGTGRTIYILDEPTTGLHFEDIRKLIELLHELVEQGNTVLVIEHNMDVLKSCDWLIDMGPEGGKHGGEIVGVGTPEAVAKVTGSFTGHYLKELL